MRVAQVVGDFGIQGALLQHWGGLHGNQGHYDRAVDLLKQAITLFQRAANVGEEMRTCNLLATVEKKRGQLNAAEAWYARSRELALKLNDQDHLAVVAQNVGILYQTRAIQTQDLAQRTALLRQGVASVQESLTVWLELGNQVDVAASYQAVGNLYRMLGEFDQAEKSALQSLQIHESLNLPDVYKDYGNLARIAQARGNADAAARWQAKYEAKVKELERLRRVPGDTETRGQEETEQLAKLIDVLAHAAYNARTSRAALRPDVAEWVAKLVAAQPPLDAVGVLLQDVASGKPVPPVPPGLPEEIAGVLNALGEAVEKSDKELQ